MGLAAVPGEGDGDVRDAARRRLTTDVRGFAAAVPAEVLALMTDAGPPAWAAYLAELRIAAGVDRDGPP